MSARDVLASDFKHEPWWWQAAPRPSCDAAELPANVDAVVVGSGFTGCSAALALARGGRDVLVLEADVLGFGASSRNAGFVGKTFKHSLSDLSGKLGDARAIAIYRELDTVFEFVAELVRSEQIDCHFRRCGRFMLARTPSQYESMAHELAFKEKHLGHRFHMVPRAEQADEIGSDKFHGGAVIHDLGSIHPGLYQLGLLERARDAGARFIGQTPVLGIRRERGHFEISTTNARVMARDVVIATNGYTAGATPWLRRRVVPFQGFMIATERLSEDRLSTVFPKARTYHDYHHNLTFTRTAPDEPRVLYGAYTGTLSRDLDAMAMRLQAKLVEDIPILSGVRLARVWSGFCAGTFDLWPHIGVHDGMHYAMGYCYAGLPMGTWLGRKMAARILGETDTHTEFAQASFPSMPLYWGGSWPVPFAMAWYNFQDRRAMRQ